MNRTSLNGVSILRAAHLPAPQLLIGSRALEHVARRHRKHPNQGRVPTGTRQQCLDPLTARWYLTLFPRVLVRML